MTIIAHARPNRRAHRILILDPIQDGIQDLIQDLILDQILELSRQNRLERLAASPEPLAPSPY